MAHKHKGQYVCQWCNSCALDLFSEHMCPAFVSLYMLDGVRRKPSAGSSNLAAIDAVTVQYLKRSYANAFERGLF